MYDMFMCLSVEGSGYEWIALFGINKVVWIELNWIIAVGWCFDLYTDSCYYSEWLKHQPLLSHVCILGYQCKLITLIFGSLRHIHKNVVRGLRLGEFTREGSRQICNMLLCFSHHRKWMRILRQMLCLPWSLLCYNLNLSCRSCEGKVSCWTEPVNISSPNVWIFFLLCKFGSK